MSEPSREEPWMENYSNAQIAERMRQSYDSTGDKWFKAAAIRLAAKPERGRVMSKDELETEMRDLAMTVKVATIEACAKVAERFYDVDHSREQEVAVDGHYWVHSGRVGMQRADCWLADAWISDQPSGEGSIGEWNTRCAAQPPTLPPVPIEWCRPQGATFEEMRANVWKTGLADKGDTVLVWVNEGDFLHAQIVCGAKEHKLPDSAVTPSPVAVDRYAVDDPWCRPVGMRDMLAPKGLALTSATVAGEWRPIETAPKDQEVEVRGIWKLRGDGVQFTHWRPSVSSTEGK